MNYAILFTICDKYGLDLNEIIFGKSIVSDTELVTTQEKKLSYYAESDVADRSVKVVDMIQNLPIPVMNRRKILENYLNILNEELRDKELN